MAESHNKLAEALMESGGQLGSVDTREEPSSFNSNTPSCNYLDVPLYWAAQTSGAFVRVLIIYTLNEPAIRSHQDPSLTIGIFIPGLQTPTTSLIVGLFAEFLSTALLVFVILATSEGRGITPADPRFQLVVVGMN
ncbi:hypothetical protein BG015_011956 [Linnemannia schmuckeri]|uniref:Aquaporin n=1 Tax=Linnemannia schmuckeri TaxID=64567 RepID=A0A9P5RTZ1_9FUNG|nr:hypothetical protein BG015_011956 [Linnemannia schmuckeri]